jgi:hypothetical protein
MFTQMFFDLLSLVGIVILLGIGIIAIVAVMAIVIITVNAVKSTLHENKEETKHE